MRPLTVGLWDQNGLIRGHHPGFTAHQPLPEWFTYKNRTSEYVDVCMATCDDIHHLLPINFDRKVLYLQETSETHPPTDIELYRKFDLVLTHDLSVLSQLDNARYMTLFGTWITNFRVSEKTKNVSFIASDNNITSGHRLRHQVAREVAGYDGYGKACGNPIEDKADSLRDYRFQIVIENSSEPYWHTEKIFDCFAMKAIPIYCGPRDLSRLAEWGFDHSGVIQWSHIDDLKRVLDNLDTYPYAAFSVPIEHNYRRIQDLRCNEIALAQVFRERWPELR